MKLRLTFYLLTALILTSNSSCHTSTKKQSTADDLLQLVSQLDEFKQEEKRVDSINKTSSIPVEVTVSIVDSSFLVEDKGKNIALAFITERYPYEDRIMYTIKFDKDRKKVTAINKDEKQFKKSDLANPEDIPLPPKQ